ncbi:pentatricopeptide repeat-containing protein [Tanacetum coccineum]|uniref:Pentatricopeptide repeat-containing protein n=1 Tax=Tanacetum coccineum TaxID=301880 RepID=A0ABQ5BU28_9ASTR
MLELGPASIFGFWMIYMEIVGVIPDEPLPEHYACIVYLLGRVGRLEPAFKMANEMKIDGNVGTWGALLDACRAGKDLNLAKFAAKKLLEIEPEKRSNNVMLSNLNAKVGRWEVVEKVMDSLKEGKTKQYYVFRGKC